MIPIVTGIFLGVSKPGNMNEFLGEFCREFKEISENGVQIGEKRFDVDSKLRIICDRPAVAMCTCYKGSGYDACMICDIHGEAVKNIGGRGSTVYYPGTIGNLRNEDFFRDCDTPLRTILKLNLSNDILIDCMHTVDLGVVLLVVKWLKLGSFRGFDESHANHIEDVFQMARVFQPKEFSRKFQNFSSLPWKALDYRNFLHYLVPVIFSDLIEQGVNDPLCYQLLSFALAIRILSYDPYWRNEFYVAMAKEKIKEFVKVLEKEIGNRVTWKIHSLLHLADEVTKHGIPLDGNSAYDFETNNFRIIQHFKSGQKKLKQIAIRTMEVNSCLNDIVRIESIKKKFSVQKCERSTIVGRDEIKALWYCSAYIEGRHGIARDCVFKLRNSEKIIIVKKILPMSDSNIKLLCDEVLDLRSLYVLRSENFNWIRDHTVLEKVESSDFLMLRSNLASSLIDCEVSLTDLDRKFFVMPRRGEENSFVLIGMNPIVHS